MLPWLYSAGSYERRGSGYKHVYFNLTSNTFKIWALTITAAIVAYECVRRLVALFLDGRLRYSMLVLFVSAIYPHYYAWWSYFNAWNDDFYAQWNHQHVFSITELISTAIIAYLCDVTHQTKPRLLLVIACIATLHIIASTWDQFVHNIIQQEGRWHQRARDLGLMIPDLLHLLVPVAEIVLYSRKNDIPLRRSVAKWDLYVAIGGVVIMMIVCLHLW